MKPYLPLAFVAITLTTVHARIHETEQEIEARYGKPVCQSAYSDIDRNSKPPNFAENFRRDGTPKDLPQDDGLYLASSRLIFFNTATSKWEDLWSRVVGRTHTNQDNEALQQLTSNARKHLRQRFYILDDIAISVIYLGGRSVSES